MENFLDCHHDCRLDQMVWAKFSEFGGFWPGIIACDIDEPEQPWCVGDSIHVNFISPPFVRAYGQVIKVLVLLYVTI